jgi:hypothetical protein
MARLIDYVGFWVIAATPVKGLGWTYDLLWEPAQNDPNSKIGTFTLRMEDNPYIRSTLEDRDFYFMAADDEERAIREKGEFIARSGLVFPSISQNQAAYTLQPSQMVIPPKDWVWYSSTDFGWNNPTAWLWHAVGPQGQIITFAEHYADHLAVPAHAQIVKDRENAWGKTPEYRVGDPNNGAAKYGTTGTSYVSEYATRGIYIDVESIPRNVMIGIEKMQQYLQLQPKSPWGENRPWWVISANCPNFLREMKKLRWATYSSDKLAYDLNKQEVVHKRDDHAFDSARYFSTLMPDLSVVEPTSQIADQPTTISYQELLAKMAEDPTVEYVDDSREQQWETETYYDDIYEGEFSA